MRGAVIVTLAILGLGAAGCGSTRHTVNPAPSRASALAAPVPVGEGSRFSEELSTVACPAAGDCVAAGYGYTLGRPPSAPVGLLLSETHGRWGVATVPAPANLPSGGKAAVGFAAVSCPAVGHCVAIGSAHAKAGADVLILTQQGKRWPLTVLKLPDGAALGGLDALACPAPGSCSAAGWFQRSPAAAPKLLYLDERHGRWGRGQEWSLPHDVDRSASVSVDRIACAAPGQCTAIGGYTDTSGRERGLILSERNGTWRPAFVPAPPANAGSRGLIDLASLACPSTGDCTVIGSYFDRHQSQEGFALTERHGRWGKAVELPLPANAGENIQHGNDPEPVLTDLSCASVGNCSATGFYRSGKDREHVLVLSERAGKWTAPEVELPADAAAGVYPGGLGEVACVSPGNCLAGGGYVTGTRPNGEYVTRPLLLVERDGVWQPGVPGATSAGLGDGATASLSMVTCPPRNGDCLAVGTYTDTSHVDHGELLAVARP